MSVAREIGSSPLTGSFSFHAPAEAKSISDTGCRDCDVNSDLEYPRSDFALRYRVTPRSCISKRFLHFARHTRRWPLERLAPGVIYLHSSASLFGPSLSNLGQWIHTCRWLARAILIGLIAAGVNLIVDYRIIVVEIMKHLAARKFGILRDNRRRTRCRRPYGERDATGSARAIFLPRCLVDIDQLYPFSLNGVSTCSLQEKKVTMLRAGSILGLLVLLAIAKIVVTNRCLTMLEGKPSWI